MIRIITCLFHIHSVVHGSKNARFKVLKKRAPLSSCKSVRSFTSSKNSEVDDRFGVFSATAAPKESNKVAVETLF